MSSPYKMDYRDFTFDGPEGKTHKITLLCRQPPEEQTASLTWQLPPPPPGPAGPAGDGCTCVCTCGAAAAAAAAAERRKEAEAAAEAAEAPDLIGCDVWPASIALGRYLAASPCLVGGEAVIELGAGMGLVGLLCASLGASSVLLTDYESRVLSYAEHSATTGCTTQRLDWRSPGEGLRAEQRGTWRRVVAADVLYCTAIAQPLAATLQMLLRPEGIALIGHQIRRAIVLDRATGLPKLEDGDEPLEAFKAACTAAGLQLRELGSRSTCSAVDTAPMVLLAVGGGAASLDGLPAPPGEDAA